MAWFPGGILRAEMEGRKRREIFSPIPLWSVVVKKSFIGGWREVSEYISPSHANKRTAGTKNGQTSLNYFNAATKTTHSWLKSKLFLLFLEVVGKSLTKSPQQARGTFHGPTRPILYFLILFLLLQICPSDLRMHEMGNKRSAEFCFRETSCFYYSYLFSALPPKEKKGLSD